MTVAAMPEPPPALTLSLADLARVLGQVGARVVGDASTRVGDVRHDSRSVEPGDLFVARAGASASGLEHVADAVRRGAAALIVERAALSDAPLPLLEVDDARVALALAAEAVHGTPTRSLRVVGITGTNGKTTTSWLVERALAAAGARPARLGTLGYAFESDHTGSPLTTPEADEISRLAARVRDAGGTHLVMEASSHALSQARVDAVHFAVAAFTNLTQDHLDYHGDMQSYAAAKRRLFTELEPEASVVNVDDPEGARIADLARGRVLSVSRAEGDVCAASARLDARGIALTARLPSGEVTLESRLVGEHNLDNLLLTLGIVEALGLDVARAARGLAHAPAVPGRLERCDEPGDDIVVLVDYAHTPDALGRALAAARSLTAGKVVCVFGCGGDRDPTKRPRMGEAVARGADRAIVTNDNPRSERPEDIARAIEPGLAGATYEVILDRAGAISRAIQDAQPGDVVLVAGKGHEPYQIIGAARRDFDDRVEARRALAARRKGRAS
jgi:UDP-N-acetylmuramoyl-L-alanyl-D-glutamate--2,6-diaminopimelate ligase